MKTFRQSKEAIILDTLLTPFGVIYSIIMQGIPETLNELKSFDLKYRWGDSYWYLF